MNATLPAEESLLEQAVETGSATLGNVVVLPGAGVTITATAEALFKRIAPTKSLFNRGGAVVGIVEANGSLELEVVSPNAARSRFENYATLVAWRSGGDRGQMLKPSNIPLELAAALLATTEARTLLPTITGLVNCPIIGVDGEIIGRGHHKATGLFITGGKTPPAIELLEAITALTELVSEYDFQTPGDRSRAVASFITPALKLGGHITGNVPADVAEADKSQSGKTYRQKVVAAVYNEKPALVTLRAGGVGSTDESLNQQLISGRPFIQMDNFRGRFDSPHVEALLTAEKSFPVRVPHCREITIDPSRFFLMLTSNGVDCTRDFANRASFVRIKKRDGYTYKSYPEGDLLQHVRANQPFYLGCVFAIVREWIANGKPRTKETHHDFREWCQNLDWIVRGVIGAAPLMDGHQQAQERVSNPALTFLRKLALAVADQDRLNEALIASVLYEIAEAGDVSIPGLKESNEEQGKRQIGTVVARLFKATATVELDGFRVTRNEVETQREGGGAYTAKNYHFERIL